jgi:hypothetical protein
LVLAYQSPFAHLKCDKIQTLFDTSYEKTLHMAPLFLLLTLLTGFTIPLLPLLPGFFPRLGLLPLRLGHHRPVRLFQALVVWLFAILTLQQSQSAWGWVAILAALWFSFVAVNFFSERVFIALEQPEHAQTGLADSAPVLATAVAGEVIAYPLETLVPHHLVNDILGEIPVLASW